MAAGNTKTTTRQWRDIVAKADDDNRHRDSLYPIAYKFTNRTFRDSGPTKGVYETS